MGIREPISLTVCVCGCSVAGDVAGGVRIPEPLELGVRAGDGGSADQRGGEQPGQRAAQPEEQGAASPRRVCPLLVLGVAVFIALRGG